MIEDAMTDAMGAPVIKVVSGTVTMDIDSRLTKLEFSFVSLCNSLDARIGAIEAALDKQRAVNEMLLDSAQYLPITGEKLAAAIHETLK